MSEAQATLEKDVVRPKIELRAEAEIVGEGAEPEATDEVADSAKKKK